jgi:UDPglucose 6-dehydrogenase
MTQTCVVGVGYAGLVTPTCFADPGNQIIALDVYREKINGLKQGKLPDYEPSLKELVEQDVQAQHLSFTTSYADALLSTELVFIAVGTPVAVGRGTLPMDTSQLNQ